MSVFALIHLRFGGHATFFLIFCHAASLIVVGGEAPPPSTTKVHEEGDFRSHDVKFQKGIGYYGIRTESVTKF